MWSILVESPKVRKVVKNAGIIFSGNSFASGLNFISFTLMAKKLGPEMLGGLVLAQNYAYIINDILNIQTWESMVKFGSERIGKDRRALASVIKTNFLLDAASAIVAFIVAITSANTVVARLNWTASLVPITKLYSIYIIFNITTFTIGIPRLYDKFLSIAKIQVSMAIMKLISVLVAFLVSGSIIVFVSIYLVVDVITNISLTTMSFRVLNRELGRDWWKEKFILDKGQLWFVWWTNLRSIIRIPVRHLDMIIIGSIISVREVGIYKVFREICGILSRVGEPINQSIFPEYTKLLGEGKGAETANLALKITFIMGCTAAIVAIPVFLASKFIIGTFFGARYLSDIPAFYGLLGLYAIGFATVPINSLLVATGFVKTNFVIILCSNSAYLITAVLAGPVWGIYGMVLAYGCQLLCNKGLKLLTLTMQKHRWIGYVEST